MTRYLVPGGAGFIGSNYIRFLLSGFPDAQAVVLDKLTYAGRRENLQDIEERFGPRCQLLVGDICDAETVTQAFHRTRPDRVVNFAAETHVDRSIMDPEVFVRTGVLGTHQLLQAALEYGVERYHQISTDEVYGPVAEAQYSRETDPLCPRSPYAASKAGGDLLVQAYHQTYGLPISISRAANCVGPYQYPEKAVPLFATNALEDMPLPIYGDGRQKRDYQHVMDHCAGIQAVLDHGQAGEVYNIGTGTELANLAMVHILLEALGKPRSLIRHVEDRPGHDCRYGLNISKILQLGWVPVFSCEESIRTAVHWYADNPWWWRPIRTGAFQEYYRQQYGQRQILV